MRYEDTDDNCYCIEIHYRYICDVSTPHRFPIRILAENIARPSNVGALFRIADALGVEALHLCGDSFFPPHQKIRRVARSAESWVPYHVEDNGQTTMLKLKQEGYRVIGLEITPDSQDIRMLGQTTTQPTCLVIGSERQGLSPSLISACETIYHIPMYGRGHSMNVAVATGIALHELTRQAQ